MSWRKNLQYRQYVCLWNLVSRKQTSTSFHRSIEWRTRTSVAMVFYCVKYYWYYFTKLQYHIIRIYMTSQTFLQSVAAFIFGVVMCSFDYLRFGISIPTVNIIFLNPEFYLLCWCFSFDILICVTSIYRTFETPRQRSGNPEINNKTREKVCGHVGDVPE